MRIPYFNHLTSCKFLLQISVFVTVLQVCLSVTYHPSNEETKGDDLSEKCKDPRRLARINEPNSLKEAIEEVQSHKGHKFWTALRWERNRGFWWDADEDIPTQVDDRIIGTSLAGLKGNRCFLVNTTGGNLVAEDCRKKNYYICEQRVETTTRSEIASTATSELITFVEVMATLFSPTTSTVARAVISPTTITSAALRVTASSSTTTSTTTTVTEPVNNSATLATTRVVVAAEATSAKAATATVKRTILSAAEPTETAETMKRSGLTTPSVTTIFSANTVSPRSTATMSLTKAKETTALPTVRAELFIAEDCTENKATQDEHSAKDKLDCFIKDIKALSAKENSSLQIAINATSRFFKSLKTEQIKANDFNVLLATRELESFAIRYARIHYEVYEGRVISKEHFAIKIQKLPADNKGVVAFYLNETEYPAKERWASISLPPETFKGKDAVVVFIVYNDIEKFVKDQQLVQLNGQNVRSLKLGSMVIAGRVDPTPTGILDENVTISLSYDKEAKDKEKPHCLFWDFSIKSELHGAWSGRGCSLVKIVNNEITCSCNHLTNFAVLMQVREHKRISAKHRVALEVITYIGCALSLTGEVLTIIAYGALMNLRQEHIQIRLNLVVAIAIAQIVFLTGIDASQTKGVCVLVAALIHFFYLAGFAWMLFEGVYLYLVVVKVFNTVVRMRLFYSVSWGLPAVIVVISLVIASNQDGGVHSYVHGDFCWVSSTNNLVWTFATPVLVVCLINAVLIGLVVYEILKLKSPKTSELERMKSGAKACIVLLPLLGMTWVFGVLSVAEAGITFQYTFTILNSLQGFFIFILHVVRNGDLCAEFQRRKEQWKEMKNITASRTTKKRSLSKRRNKVANSKNVTHELERRDNAHTSRVSSGFQHVIVFHQQENLPPVDS